MSLLATYSELKTPRLILRPINQAVMDNVFQKLSKSEAMHFLGLTTEEQFEAEKEKHKTGLSTYNRTFLYHHLLDPKNKNVIGWCGFHTWYTSHNRAELGYVMTDVNYKNQGLMTEALSAVLHFGFNEMALHRIEAFVSPSNTASLKLLARHNFVEEGLLRQHYKVKNVHEDSAVFALLKDEYSKQHNV